MLTYPYKDCPWTVRHKVQGDKHLAWRQRAFMVGDFLGERPARSDFVIEKDDTPGDWTKRPRCETCGLVPEVEDLIVIERATGADHFLDIAKAQRREGRVWKATRDDRCRWCQTEKGTINEQRLCRRCQEIEDEPVPEKPPKNRTMPEMPPTPPIGEIPYGGGEPWVDPLGRT